MNNSEEIRAGLLVMGMSNTVFFGEGVVHEIVLVNLATGEDFSMPISEEQASVIINQLNAAEPVKEQSLGEADAAAKSAWGETEATPQL